MLTEEQQQLFAAAKQAQVFRNEAAHIITADADVNVLVGSFVRVLLELQNDREDYFIARIGGITTGVVYSGFSVNAATRTDKHLMLVLPPAIATDNGMRYQLNSISNSMMSEAEFLKWLDMMHRCSHMPPPFQGNIGGHPPIGFAVPAPSELRAMAERVAAVVASSGASAARQGQCARLRRASPVPIGRPPVVVAQSMARPQEGPPPTQHTGASAGGGAFDHMNGSPSTYGDGVNATDPSVFGGINNNHNNNNNNNNNGDDDDSATRLSRQGTMASINSRRGTPCQHTISPQSPSLVSGTAVAADPSEIAMMEKEFDLPTRRQVKQDVINKMSQRSVLFPQSVNELKVSQLRIVERDMIEYLEHVRMVISSKQENCIVCMDHVPTVISLPCRHKILCRLCAASVNTCPACRSPLFELFEAKEI